MRVFLEEGFGDDDGGGGAVGSWAAGGKGELVGEFRKE